LILRLVGFLMEAIVTAHGSLGQLTIEIIFFFYWNHVGRRELPTTGRYLLLRVSSGKYREEKKYVFRTWSDRDTRSHTPCSSFYYRCTWSTYSITRIHDNHKKYIPNFIPYREWCFDKFVTNIFKIILTYLFLIYFFRFDK